MVATSKRDSRSMVEHIRSQERERCAKLAESVGVLEAAPTDEFECGLHEAAQRIAYAIRNEV